MIEGDRQRQEARLAEVLGELALDFAGRAAVAELGDRQFGMCLLHGCNGVLDRLRDVHRVFGGALELEVHEC